jgi:hypothetical protein
MKVLLPKWIFASLAKHFSTMGLPLHVEGQKRVTNSMQDWTEFIMDGPDFNEVSRKYYHLALTVTVLINSLENNNDGYRYIKNSGLVASFFNNSISIYKYGDTVLDDGSYYGCVKVGSPVIINHYGQATPNAPVFKSSVTANYYMETII